MKMTRTGLVAASLSIAMSCAHAQPGPEAVASPGGWTIDAFQPELTRNDAPEMCVPYAEAWTDLINGTALMDSDALDIARIPHDAIFSFPPTREEGADTRYGGLYGQYYSVHRDLDGDGDKEVLLIVSDDLGWRYLGSNLYVFETEAEFEAIISQFQAKATYFEKTNRYHPAWKLAELLEDTMPDAAIHFGPLRRVHLILYQGAIYTVSDEAWYMRYQPDVTHETLRRIWPVADAGPVCEMRVRPQPEAFAPFTSGSPFFQALKAMYAGPEQGGMCYGTMGWTGIPPERLLPDIFLRPQVTPEPRGIFRPEDDTASDLARRLRPLIWGASDPASWQVYLSLRQAEPEFLRRMKAYYTARFGMLPDQADAATLRAWRALIDRVFYARNSDFATAFLARASDTLSVSEMPVSDEQAGAAILSAYRGDVLERYSDSHRWSRALSIGVLTGQPVSDIADLYTRTLADYDAMVTPRNQSQLQRSVLWFNANSLVTAVTRPDVLKMFLDKRVNPDIPTNYFGKTALMYAAQGNEAEAARLLLAANADINIRTQSVKEAQRYRTCGQLERDNRSALMYAAENASEELIGLLLDAGADTTAQDTQGNGVIWYLEQNTRLDEEARARLARRLGDEDVKQAD